MDCENCRHLAVVGFHDTGPETALCMVGLDAVTRAEQQTVAGRVSTRYATAPIGDRP